MRAKGVDRLGEFGVESVRGRDGRDEPEIGAVAGGEVDVFAEEKRMGVAGEDGGVVSPARGGLVVDNGVNGVPFGGVVGEDEFAVGVAVARADGAHEGVDFVLRIGAEEAVENMVHVGKGASGVDEGVAEGDGEDAGDF